MSERGRRPTRARLVPGGPGAGGDQHGHPRQPDGGHALHQADDRHHGRGHGRGRAGGHRRAGRRPRGAGRAAGVPPRERCWPRSPSTMAARPEPWRSPAMAAAMRCCLGGIASDEVAHLDLYSCFASSLSFAARCARHRRPDRALTVTGGLPYHGDRAATTAPTPWRPWPRCCGRTRVRRTGLGNRDAHDQPRGQSVVDPPGRLRPVGAGRTVRPPCRWRAKPTGPAGW